MISRHRGLCSEQTNSGENAMAQGLILLVFIGILIAVFTVRVRRRMGIASNSKTWLMIITWAVVLGLALWASATH
jgi:hypothetical protein